MLLTILKRVFCCNFIFFCQFFLFYLWIFLLELHFASAFTQYSMFYFVLQYLIFSRHYKGGANQGVKKVMSFSNFISAPGANQRKYGIYLSHLKPEKKTELNELSELEYLKHPHRSAAMLTDMLSCICMLKNKSNHFFIHYV